MKEYFVSIIDVARIVHKDGPIGIDPQYICPHYSNCRTAQSAPLPMDFCTMYKCATFYHLRNEQVREEIPRLDIVKIVEQHLHGNSNGNGNGHRGNGSSNGKERKQNPIASSFCNDR